MAVGTEKNCTGPVKHGISRSFAHPAENEAIISQTEKAPADNIQTACPSSLPFTGNHPRTGQIPIPMRTWLQTGQSLKQLSGKFKCFPQNLRKHITAPKKPPPRRKAALNMEKRFPYSSASMPSPIILRSSGILPVAK